MLHIGPLKEHKCDGRCQTATQPKCTCICGGENHGIKCKLVTQNVIDEVISIIKERNHA